MRILLLSQGYDPEPNFKAHTLARALTLKGHQVTVITGFPNYPGGRVYPGYRIHFYQWDMLDGVKILRVPVYPSHDKSPVRRSLNYLSFSVSASFIGTALCGKADVMWVYSPLPNVAIPACWFKMLHRVPFVYEVQDLWPETLFASGIISSVRVARFIAQPIKLLNTLAYDNASAITVISPGFKRNLIKKGVPERKIHFISNWVDEDLYRPVPRDEALALKYGFTNRFNIVFAGNMGLAQGLGNVLDAAMLLHDLPKVRFVLIGYGIDFSRLRRAAEERKLDNVHFISRQPEEKMPHFFALADALLVHLKRDPLFEITIPSKMIAYLACGKPILCCASGDTAQVVQNAGAGLVCLPQDPIALADTVRKFFAMPEEERQQMGRRGRQAFLDKYTKSILVQQYEALFKEIVKT